LTWWNKDHFPALLIMCWYGKMLPRIGRIPVAFSQDLGLPRKHFLIWALLWYDVVYTYEVKSLLAEIPTSLGKCQENFHVTRLKEAVFLQPYYGVASKSGDSENSGKCREFYFQSGWEDCVDQFIYNDIPPTYKYNLNYIQLGNIRENS